MNHDTANTMIVKTYENEGLLLNVQFTGEAFFNATAVAKAFGKRPGDWLRLDETVEYISEVCAQATLQQNQLVISKMGAPENGGGTWLHPDLGIPFARWLSVKFAVWADRQVKAILMGQQQPMSVAEIILQQAQMLVAVEQEQKRQADELKRLSEQQRITDGKIEDFANGAEHFSITAYNKLFRNTQISHSQANKDGRMLTRIAKNNGVELGKAPHPAWGSVHTYPKAMMDAYYRGEYH